MYNIARAVFILGGNKVALLGHKRQKDTADGRQVVGSPSYHEWLQSDSPPGEAFGDTGLSSAADCRKLHWSPGKDEDALFDKLMEQAVRRDRNLSASDSTKTGEGQILNLAAAVLTQAGLDPMRFGVSSGEPVSDPSNGTSASGGA